MDLTTVDPRTNKRVTSVVRTSCMAHSPMAPGPVLSYALLSQAYLDQAGSRPNLKILTNAPVARILSASGAGFVANGVEFLYEGTKHTASITGNGEVILSAG